MSGSIGAREDQLLLDDGHLELRWSGAGDPVTVFAHGLAGEAGELSAVAAGVEGTRALFSWRGHGGSSDMPGLWDYALLSADLLAVADAVAATQAVGASMGAGAVLRVLLDHPGRFERIALLTPSVLDDRTGADPELLGLNPLADLVQAGDEDGLAAALLSRLPAVVRSRPAVAARLTRAQAARLVQRPPARGVPGAVPVHDRSELARIDVPALVLAQEGDPLHPVRVAEDFTAALPAAELVVLGEGGLHFTERARARDLIADFLAS